MLTRFLLPIGGVLGLAVGGVAMAGMTATTSPLIVDGEAYAAFVDTSLGSLTASPRAILPGEEGMDGDNLGQVSVPGVLEVEGLAALTTGGGDPGEASAQSAAALDRVDVLNGLITARGVVSMATSIVDDGSILMRNATGTTFIDLEVAGVPVAAEVPPNTRINLPGVGYVVLNEQIPSGNGSTSIGLRVNALHVVLTAPIVGTKIGEIILASAYSHVGQ